MADFHVSGGLKIPQADNTRWDTTLTTAEGATAESIYPGPAYNVDNGGGQVAASASVTVTAGKTYVLSACGALIAVDGIFPGEMDVYDGTELVATVTVPTRSIQTATTNHFQILLHSALLGVFKNSSGSFTVKWRILYDASQLTPSAPPQDSFVVRAMEIIA